MTRQDKINKGKIWTISFETQSLNADRPDVFEGTRAQCIKYLKENKLFNYYKTGKSFQNKGIPRLGKIIWEPEDS